MIGLSGASEELLKETGKFEEKERIKYARYGRLVLIPAILGGLAGGYAFTTILDNLYLSIAFGFLWFFIVLAVDMAMSATLYKQRKLGWGFWWAVIFRLAFSVCVGVVISHPLVLRIFEPSIEKYIRDRDDDKKEAAILKAKDGVNDAKQEFQTRIDYLKAKNQCLTDLIQFERSRGNTYPRDYFIEPKKTELCGTSSGDGGGCSTECHKKEAIIEANAIEIGKQETEMLNSAKPESAILEKKELDKAIPATKDYLARTEALGLLADGDPSNTKYKPHPHISAAVTWLIAFFIVLDCLIVIFKASTPIGAYELASEILLENFVEKVKAEGEAYTAYVKTIAVGQAKVKALNETKIAEVMSVRELITETFKRVEADAEAFKLTKKKMMRDVGFFDSKRRKEVKQEIEAMEDLMDAARIATINKLTAVLPTL